MLLIALAFFLILCFLLLMGLYNFLKGGKDPNQGNADRREDVLKLWKLYLFYLVIALLLGSYLYDKGYDRIINAIKNDDSPVIPYRR